MSPAAAVADALACTVAVQSATQPAAAKAAAHCHQWPVCSASRSETFNSSKKIERNVEKGTENGKKGERVTQSTATVVVVVAELSSSSDDGYGRNANVTR